MELLDFPTEILDEILWQAAEVCKIQYISFGHARLACRDFNNIIEPTFYSEIVINFNKRSKNLLSTQHQLISIGTGISPACRHTKKLLIRSLNLASKDPSDEVELDPETRKMEFEVLHARYHYLGPTIKSLRALNTVMWQTQPNDPYSLGISSGLAALPQLESLHLSLRHCCYERYASLLTRLPFIKRLSLAGTFTGDILPNDLREELMDFLALNPVLSHLTITQGGFRSRNSSRSASFSELIQSVPPSILANPPLRSLHLEEVSLSIDGRTASYLSSLTSLEITQNDKVFRSQGGQELWKMLRESQIHLASIKTNWLPAARRSFFDYLTSYSGLEALTLTFALTSLPLPADSEYDSECDADYFFTDIVPRHRRTLALLDMKGWDAGQWCLQQDYLVCLLQCQKLKTLGFFISLEGEVVSLDQLWKAMAQLPKLRALHLNPTHQTENINLYGQFRELFKSSFLCFPIDSPRSMNFEVSLFHLVYAIYPDAADGKYRFRVQKVSGDLAVRRLSPSQSWCI